MQILNYIFKILNMNGYGMYVWLCYGVFLSLLAWQVVVALRRNVALQDTLKQKLWDGSLSDSQP